MKERSEGYSCSPAAGKPRLIDAGKVVVFLALALAIFSCRNHRPEGILHIYQTSDIHGAILPRDFVDDTIAPTSLAQVSAYVREKRERGNVLLLDNGDILQGQPLVYYSSYVDTLHPHICSEAMRFMGVDAATVGNHDIEAGPGVYNRLMKDFGFPWLGANVVVKATGEPYFEPYTVIRKNGWIVAVFGLTTPETPNWLPGKLWEGLEFRDMLETAREWVPRILEKEKPHLLVGLFHSGTGGGTTEEGNSENAGRYLAEQVPGFDLVLTGHDHRPLQSYVINVEEDTVWLLNPGSRAMYLSGAEIRMGDDGPVIQTSLIPMKDMPSDSLFLESFSPYGERTDAWLSVPVGRMKSPVYAREALFGDAAFTDLVHRIQMDVAGTELSFAAPLSMNASVEGGEITVRDLFALYWYENFLYRMELSGKEIKDYLEYSYAGWLAEEGAEGDHLLRFRKDREGNLLYNEQYNTYSLSVPAYNFDSAEGIAYTVDMSAPAGKRVNILSMQDGSPFYPDSLYRVAVNSYRGSGGGGHLTAGAGIPHAELPGRILFATGRDLRHYMMEWFMQREVVEPNVSGNWIILPESWCREAGGRDYSLMFHGRKPKN